MTTDDNEQLPVTDTQTLSESGHKHTLSNIDVKVHVVRKKRKRAKLHTSVIPSANSASPKICSTHKTGSNALSDSSDGEDDDDIAEKLTPNTSRKHRLTEISTSESGWKKPGLIGYNHACQTYSISSSKQQQETSLINSYNNEHLQHMTKTLLDHSYLKKTHGCATCPTEDKVPMLEL